MKIISCAQGSPEWHASRLGIPTASEFDSIISPNWVTRYGEGPKTYLYTKICEKVLGFAQDECGSWAMGQGSILETECIPWFEFAHDIKIDRVGFCTTDDGRVGCSPDGLIGEDGGIEAKCPQPKTHLKYLMEGKLPLEYATQVHGGMYVTGRKWWKFVSYSRQFPALVLHIDRDEEIQRRIGDTLEDFLGRFDLVYSKIKAMKDAENAAKSKAYQESGAGQ